MISSFIRSVEDRLTPNLGLFASCGLALVCSAILLPALLQADDAMRNGVGQLYGHDFGPIWSAGRAFLEIGPAAPWDAQAFGIALERTFPSHETVLIRFNYPPPALFAIVPFASLPLPLAFPLMAASGVAFLLYALWCILPDWRTPLMALGTPVLLQVIAYGQWSLWLAALMAFALMPVARQRGPAPWASALFVMKPTLGLLLPLTCLGTKDGMRSAAWTAAIAAALIALSVLMFGAEAWQSYFAALPGAQRFLMGGLDVLMAHSTTFGSCLQRLGATAESARLTQYVWTAAILLLVAWMLRSKARGDLKAAAMASGTALAAPYFMSYDLAILLPAAAFYIRDAHMHGFRTGDRLVIALCAILPAFASEIQNASAIPAGFIASLIFFAMSATRAIASIAKNESGPERGKQKPDCMIPAQQLFQHEH